MQPPFLTLKLKKKLLKNISINNSIFIKSKYNQDTYKSIEDFSK